MICDVCGHQMRRLSITSNQHQDEEWLCSWCYAVTVVGPGQQEVSRPAYMPMNLRWERAVAEGLPADISHAYGYFSATLCGIRRDGMSPSPYPWIPGWANACQACKDAAAVIDQRWPLEMREGNRLQITPPSGPERPPF